jgi:hypothetical protein
MYFIMDKTKGNELVPTHVGVRLDVLVHSLLSLLIFDKRRQLFLQRGNEFKSQENKQPAYSSGLVELISHFRMSKCVMRT